MASNGKVQEKKDDFVSKLREDGVKNPKGLITAAFGPVFLLAMPVTSLIANNQIGLIEKTINGVCSAAVWVGTAGSTSRVAQTGKVAALSALYIGATYALTGAASVAGQAASREEGLDNNEPRKDTKSLTGLPLRLYSAHYNLLENFPGFALAAALAQAMAPGDQTLINLLGLHVIAKLFVYYPSYIFNIAPTRSLGHILATASVMNVGLQLARKPLL